MLGGSRDLVTTYNWAYNPNYDPLNSLVGVTPITSRVITPGINSFLSPMNLQVMLHGQGFGFIQSPSLPGDVAALGFTQKFRLEGKHTEGGTEWVSPPGLTVYGLYMDHTYI